MDSDYQPPPPQLANDDPCPSCDGLGWMVDHEDACYERGDCVGCGGVQVPCDDPRGHADRCLHCANGEVWDPTASGNTVACRHCSGGWVWRSNTKEER